MKIHPKLSKSPLIEVIFELRFNKKEDYTLKLAQFISQISKDYPTGSLIVPEGVPYGIPNVLRHRFSSKDTKQLIQLGEDILSVNSTSYQSFTLFSAEVSKVLKLTKKIFNSDLISRVGLRYINLIKSSKDTPLKLTLSLPQELSHNKELMTNRVLFDHANLGKLNFLVEENYDLKHIILDMDMALEQIQAFNSNKIMAWLNKAHTEIYSAFMASLKENYFESIK